jgi:cell wall-associated NlpC family hydrolase
MSLMRARKLGKREETLMRPIDGNAQFDPTSGVVTSDPNPAPAPASSPAGPAVDQPAQPPDAGAAALKRMERDLESSYFKGALDDAGKGRGGPVLYDRNVKPDAGTGTETAGPTHEAAPVRVADGFDDPNMDVRAAAGDLVGKKVVGTGECYDLADAVLQKAGAKSAPDFQKVTKKPDQDYKWGTEISPKDAKPGDILQFRNHKIVEEKSTKITRTYPDGHKDVSYKKGSEEHHRGQHTSVVLANDGDGKMSVAEQHVLDPSTGKLSGTVRRNDLYTKDRSWTSSKTHMEGKVEVKEETTTNIKVSGTIHAYRPQAKDGKR